LEGRLDFWGPKLSRENRVLSSTKPLHIQMCFRTPFGPRSISSAPQGGARTWWRRPEILALQAAGAKAQLAMPRTVAAVGPRSILLSTALSATIHFSGGPSPPAPCASGWLRRQLRLEKPGRSFLLTNRSAPRKVFRCRPIGFWTCLGRSPCAQCWDLFRSSVHHE